MLPPANSPALVYRGSPEIRQVATTSGWRRVGDGWGLPARRAGAISSHALLAPRTGGETRRQDPRARTLVVGTFLMARRISSVGHRRARRGTAPALSRLAWRRHPLGGADYGGAELDHEDASTLRGPASSRSWRRAERSSARSVFRHRNRRRAQVDAFAARGARDIENRSGPT